MKILLLLPFLLGLFFFTPSRTTATPAHCSPNAVSSATVYTNYATVGDTLIAFTYDIATTCFPTSTGYQEISIALTTTADLYGTNVLEVKDAAPPNIFTSDTNTAYGNQWLASSFTATQASNWSSFYFVMTLGRLGNPGLIEILLVSTKGGGGADNYEPLDNPAILGRGSYDGNRLSTVPSPVTLYFDSGPTLLAGTDNYAVIVRAPEGGWGNWVIWRVETGTPSIGSISGNAGNTWNNMAGGVTPHVAWYGQTLATGTARFDSSTDIMVEYLQDTFQAGVRSGTLYWPADITPTSQHDLTIPNYALAIINKTNSPTEPDAVYRLDDACQIVRTEVLPVGFLLTGLSSASSLPNNAAEGIPFLELLMGDSQSLATNLGLSATAAFLLIGLFLSLLSMVLVARFFPNPIVVLLAGMIPIVVLVMNDFLPSIVAVVTGMFIVIYLVWRSVVKSDV